MIRRCDSHHVFVHVFIVHVFISSLREKADAEITACIKKMFSKNKLTKTFNSNLTDMFYEIRPICSIFWVCVIVSPDTLTSQTQLSDLDCVPSLPIELSGAHQHR